MVAYHRVDGLLVTCGLTACTLGSSLGPMLDNEYGKPLPFLKITNCLSVCLLVCLSVCEHYYRKTSVALAAVVAIVIMAVHSLTLLPIITC